MKSSLLLRFKEFLDIKNGTYKTYLLFALYK